MTKEKKETSRTIKESTTEGKATKSEVKEAVKTVKEKKTDWQVKVEADLNALAKVIYDPRLLKINKEG